MIFQRTIGLICIATMVLTGCATPGGSQGSSSSSSETAIRCAAFGVGGAVIGGLLGGKSGAVKGVIAGLAACAVVEIATRQTKSASDVDQQYKANNHNQLPATAKVDEYTTVVTPNGAAKAGDAITVRSTIRVVAGTNQPIQEVKEVLVAYAPSGDEFKRGEKKINDTTGSGEYDNSFTLTLPSSAPQGTYKLTTQLFINGQPSTTVTATNMTIASLNAPASAPVTLASLF